MSPPKVSALMLLGDTRRFRMAVPAFEQFLAQTYQNRELVIVNTTGQRFSAGDSPLSRELLVDGRNYPTIGTLRNLALQAASGQWCMLWDDDDFSHPHRMVFQMAHRREDCCVVLNTQIRVDVHNNLICVYHRPEGIASTALFPKTKEFYFDDTLNKDEDAVLIGSNAVVLDNYRGWFPGPGLSVAFWHGLNVKTRNEFFGMYASPEYFGKRPVEFTDELTVFTRYVLSKYGLNLQTEGVE